MTELVLQRATRAGGVPTRASLRIWAAAALKSAQGALTIRVVGERESQQLNKTYRGKDKPTNVLSFGYGDQQVLGDLIICAPVLRREALEQGKTLRAHWAHMVVHGCLHLLGYDHVQDGEARRMEAREIKILKGLGFPDPYQVT